MRISVDHKPHDEEMRVNALGKGKIKREVDCVF